MERNGDVEDNSCMFSLLRLVLNSVFISEMRKIRAAMARWLRGRSCTQRTCVLSGTHVSHYWWQNSLQGPVVA